MVFCLLRARHRIADGSPERLLGLLELHSYLVRERSLSASCLLPQSITRLLQRVGPGSCFSTSERLVLSRFVLHHQGLTQLSSRLPMTSTLLRPMGAPLSSSHLTFQQHSTQLTTSFILKYFLLQASMTPQGPVSFLFHWSLCLVSLAIISFSS